MHFTLLEGGAHGVNNMKGTGGHLSKAFVIVVPVGKKNKIISENMTAVMINFSCISDTYALFYLSKSVNI